MASEKAWEICPGTTQDWSGGRAGGQEAGRYNLYKTEPEARVSRGQQPLGCSVKDGRRQGDWVASRSAR